MMIRLKYLFLALIVVMACEGPIFEIPASEDTTAPLVTITNPADQAVLSDTILVTIYAFDNAGLNNVQLFIDDSLVFDSTEAPFEYLWKTTEYAEDEYHHLKAKASDDNGNDNQTSPISVMVDNIDNILPTGTLLYPFSGQTLNGTVNIIAEAADNDSIRSLVFYINGDSVGVANSEPFMYEWDTTLEYDDHFYVVTVRINDISGNYFILGPISVFVDNEENIQEDNVPPTGTIIYPPAASTVSGTVDIQIEAFDNHEIDYVNIIINGSFSIIDETSPYGYSWNTTTEMEDADHFISATVSDSSGNTTNLMPVTVFVDNEENIIDDTTPPNIVLTDPAANQTVSGSVIVGAVANDDQGIAHVEFFQNSGSVGTDDIEPYEYTWDTSQETDDSEHIWYAKAVDNSGLTAQTQSIAVYVDNNDNVSPNGFIAQPYAGQSVSDTVEILVSASDNVGIASVEIFIDGSSIATLSNEPYSYLWDTMNYAEDNEHFISVRITDLAGNFINLQPIAVTVNNDPTSYNDTTPPVIAILTPVSGMEVSDSTQIHIFAEDNIGIGSVSIFIDDEPAIAISDSPYIHLWNTYEYANDSQHIIGATATDLYDNQTSAQSIVVYVNNLYLGIIENLTITQGVNELYLNWEAPFDANAFRIYRDDEFLVETDIVSYTDTMVSPATIHCYEVSAVNSVQIEGSLSSSVCEKSLLPPPDNLAGTVNQNSITLDWAVVTGAEQYKLYRNGVDIYIGANPTHADTGLTYGSTYNYTIASMDITGDEGPQSDPISVTTHDQVTAPTLSLVTDSTSFNLNWTTVGPANSYRLYKDTSFLIELQNTLYTDTVDSGTTSCYTVSAVDAYDTEGPYSNEECGTGD